MSGPLSRKGCFKCGELSHIAENCGSPTRLCYNCKSPDHESSACDQPRSAESKQCYGCGGIGHLAVDCPTLRANSGFVAGGQKCYACGNFGHIARICPNAAPAVGADGVTPVVNPVARGAGPPLAARIGNFGPPRGGFVGGFGRGGFRGGFVNGPRPVKCYACGNMGHLARNCPTAGAEGAVGAGAPRPPKTCYKCHEEGHIARECPQAEASAPLATVA